jgi:hypothetical protein
VLNRELVFMVQIGCPLHAPVKDVHPAWDVP